MLYNKICSYIFKLTQFEYIRVNDFKSYNFCTWGMMFALISLISVVFAPLLTVILSDMILPMFETLCNTDKVNIVNNSSVNFCTAIASYMKTTTHWHEQLKLTFLDLIGLLSTTVVFYFVFFIMGIRDRFWAAMTLGSGVVALAYLLIFFLTSIILFIVLWLDLHTLWGHSVNIYIVLGYYLLLCTLFVLWFQRVIFATIHLEGIMSYVWAILFFITWVMCDTFVLTRMYDNYSMLMST